MFHRDRPLAYLVALAAATVGLAAPGNDLQAEETAPTDDHPTFLRPANPCPTDLQALATRLLADLPSYANRVASRNLALSRHPIDPVPMVLVASPPDFTPLDLADLAADAPGQSSAIDAPRNDLQQVFFTTLERQYGQGQTVELQNYHWLLLADTYEGWYLALLYSSLGTYPSNQAPTPPWESSDGIVGQAIRLWLRDCRAGALFPTDDDEESRPSEGSTNP